MRRKLVVRLIVPATLVVLSTSALPAPVQAAKTRDTFNNAVIDIYGGNAAALATCLNLARDSAKQAKKVKKNECKAFANATAGAVDVKDVSVFVDQEGATRSTFNNVKIKFKGGDATAVASCVNYLDGTDDAGVMNSCAGAAQANGGDVVLSGVDIVVVQL